LSAKNFLARTQSPHQSAPYIVVVTYSGVEAADDFQILRGW